MVSDAGNPTFHNLMAILTAIRKALNVHIAVTFVPAWKAREMEIERLVQNMFQVCTYIKKINSN